MLYVSDLAMSAGFSYGVAAVLVLVAGVVIGFGGFSVLVFLEESFGVKKKAFQPGAFLTAGSVSFVCLAVALMIAG